MAAGTRDIARFEAEYTTGRNPHAFIPLCQALRRERRFAEALEHCQRGLEQSPDSAAGRALLVRLLSEMGRYDQALREAERAERLAPASKSLLVAKARALGNLGKMKEAEGILEELERSHLIDPEVQLLSGELRALKANQEPATIQLPPEAQEPQKPARYISLEDLAARLGEGLAPLGMIYTSGAIDLDSGKSCVEGVQGHVDSADMLFQELATACHDLDGGFLTSVMIETQQALMMAVRRQRRLVVIAVDPSIANAGRLFARTQKLLDQLCPDTRSGADTAAS